MRPTTQLTMQCRFKYTGPVPPTGNVAMGPVVSKSQYNDIQRYIEIDSRLLRVMAVVKVRASAHSNELRLFSIDRDGSGGDFQSTQLVTLNNVTTDLETLLANHQIVI